MPQLFSQDFRVREQQQSAETHGTLLSFRRPPDVTGRADLRLFHGG
jgi:hypothetical protein